MIATENLGLQGDKHAHALSPRQLLLAGVDAYNDVGLSPRTLRENLLVSFPTRDLQSGSLMQIGPEVLLWLTFQCEACGHLEHRHPGVVKAIGKRRGMLARVVRGGRIAKHDKVTCTTSSLPRFSERWQDRIKSVLERVPEGQRVEFRQLARLAGVPRSYCRAFPKILSQLPSALAGQAQAGEVKRDEERWMGHELFDVSGHLSIRSALRHQ